MATQATLDASFNGELIRPGDERYDEARGLFNGSIDRRPALIARCADTADVQAALAHARSEGLRVAVRGGGHSTAGHSCVDDGIVIDVGPIKHAKIDAEARTGRFGAGLNWGELDAATQEHGLAVPGGRVTHTGVAGLTLGSGSGWLDRKYGATCESLIGAEVVTASGEVVRAGEGGENEELLWGLRGGGGNFGVVTEFEFSLHPVGPIVYAGMVMHPRAAAPDLLRHYRDFMEAAPDEACGGVALLTAPPEDFVPEEHRGQKATGLIVLYAGDPAEGEEVMRPLVEWGDPFLRMVQPMPYTAVQQMIDGGNPWGIREYFKIDYLRELPDEAIDTAMGQVADVASPFTQVIIAPLGGALSRSDASRMALEQPKVPWFYFYLAMWWDEADTERERQGAWSFMDAMRPWAVDKAPPNFISEDEPAARLRHSFGEEKFARLQALKRRYDPDNVFSLNQNIPPA